MDSSDAKNEPPDDATVLASVQRVEAHVLGSIRSHRRRRRGLRIGASVVAGLGLFAGGVAVGAAALPPVTNPGANPGVTADGQGNVLPNQFAIDCYSSTSPGASVSEMDEPGKTGQPPSAGELFDERYPTAACDSMWSQAEISAAVGSEVEKLFARGIHHGYIRDTAGRIYHFEASGPATSSGGPTSYGIEPAAGQSVAGTSIVATIPSPVKPQGPTAVCEVASNWVNVYPRGDRSAEAVCADVGLPVWQGS